MDQNLENESKHKKINIRSVDIKLKYMTKLYKIKTKTRDRMMKTYLYNLECRLEKCTG